MKAIAGLGNPGAAYKGTRHNLGFEVVEELARRWKGRLKPWKSMANLTVVKSRDVILIEPTTFMNDSGRAVGAVTRYYHVEPENLLVVVDEAQLPLGRLRFSRAGSAGGHNGLKSVIEHLGTDFPRLRIGIARGDREWALSDRVLSRFSPDERVIVDRAIQRAVDAVEMFIGDGLLAAMNTYNAPDDDGKKDPLDQMSN